MRKLVMGTVTGAALKGLLFGVIAMPVFGLATGRFVFVDGIVPGALAGLVGGIIHGLGAKLADLG